MKIFPKNYIYPIITTQQTFKDKYNNTNAYIDMNPSLYISKEGNVTILVRKINYSKYFNKDFTLFENQSNSKYSVIRCKINEKSQIDIDNAIYCDIEHEYNIPTYYTYWKGLEDIRFIDENNILTIVPELNSSGNPSIFVAKIDNNKINSFESCKPGDVEKNWMPYINNNGQNKVIYKLSPFSIKSILDNDIEVIKLPQNIEDSIKGYHGSTNGITYNNSVLFLIHINRERSYHKWLLFNTTTNTVKTSNEFVFFSNSYIEFPCSLCSYNNKIFLSLGVNDNKAYIIETDFTNLNFFLQL